MSRRPSPDRDCSPSLTVAESVHVHFHRMYSDIENVQSTWDQRYPNIRFTQGILLWIKNPHAATPKESTRMHIPKNELVGTGFQ